MIDGLTFPSVKEDSLAYIWHESDLFERYRGTDWMKEPCRSCPEKEIDLGGCRCQAFLVTGDAAMADPVCSLSPDHKLITDAVARAQSAGHESDTQPLLFRNTANAKRLKTER